MGGNSIILALRCLLLQISWCRQRQARLGLLLLEVLMGVDRIFGIACEARLVGEVVIVVIFQVSVVVSSFIRNFSLFITFIFQIVHLSCQLILSLQLVSILISLILFIYLRLTQIILFSYDIHHFLLFILISRFNFFIMLKLSTFLVLFLIFIILLVPISSVWLVIISTKNVLNFFIFLVHSFFSDHHSQLLVLNFPKFYFF